MSDNFRPRINNNKFSKAWLGASIVLVLLAFLFLPLQGATAQVTQQTDSRSEFDSSNQAQPSVLNGPIDPSSANFNTAGTVRINNLANMEALLNIFANGLEILGMGNAGNFFMGAIVAFVLKKRLFGGVLLALCPISMIAGLATPGLINWLVASARDANLFGGPELSLVSMAPVLVPIAILAVIALVIEFVPAIMAFRSNHVNKWAIFAASFVAWLVPCGWAAPTFLGDLYNEEAI